MLKKSKLFSVVLALALVLSPILSSVQVLAKSNDVNSSTSVSIEEARIVAINQIVGDMQTTNDGNWKSGVNISKITALFGLDNNPSAYLFELKDKKNDDNGYIVVSASKNEDPIVEYSSEGKSFIDTAKSTTQFDTENRHKGKKVKTDSTKVYYLGNLTYLDEVELHDNTKQAYDISTSDYKSVNIDDMKKNKPVKNTDTKYLPIWDFASKKHIKEQPTLVGGSTPPDIYDKFITDTSLYESGFTSLSTKDCTGYNISYGSMSGFSTGNVCAPTAATNLCKYWYTRNTATYGKLRPTASWSDTFNTFFTLMKTNLKLGTPENEITPAYAAYFKKVGLSCTATFNTGSDSGRAIVDVIKTDKPCNIIINKDKTYCNGNGAHSVLALGYKQYVYNIVSPFVVRESTYIRIADGLIGTPTRFINASCSGTWNYITVTP